MKNQKSNPDRVLAKQKYIGRGIEILFLKKTTDQDLRYGMEVCYKDINGIYSKLGKITDVYLVDGIKQYILNTSFGAYHADELKLIKVTS